MSEPASPKHRFVLFHNGGVGDFLMFIFLAQQLWKSGAASHILIIVPRMGKFLQGFLAQYPYLSLVETSLRHPLGLWNLLSAAGTSTTVIIHPTIGRIPMRLKLFAWLITRARGSRLIGFQDQGLFCQMLYTHVVAYNTNQLYSDTMRDVARLAVGVADEAPPRLKFMPHPQVKERFGLVDTQYVVFHPGAGMSGRKRAFETGAAVEIIQYILKRYPRLSLILSGGSDERSEVERIAAAVGNPRVTPAISTSAGELATLIQGSRFYIGGDTGPTHLACFLGARVIEVAHRATAHWLAFYHPGATVLYRLVGEEKVHTDAEYFKRHAPGVLRPFGEVPAAAVCEAIERELSHEV